MLFITRRITTIVLHCGLDAAIGAAQADPSAKYRLHPELQLSCECSHTFSYCGSGLYFFFFLFKKEIIDKLKKTETFIAMCNIVI